MQIKEQILTITASVWIIPASEDDLFKRNIEGVTHNRYMFSKLVSSAKQKGWIYERDGILYCYKKTRKVLIENGFDAPDSEHAVSDFEKEYLKSLK